jgi:hypothetical protein
MLKVFLLMAFLTYIFSVSSRFSQNILLLLGVKIASEIHDCLAHPEVIAGELGKHIGPVLSDTVQPGSLHQLLHKVVIHKQFVEGIRSLALHWQSLHGLSPEIRHRHAKDGRLGLLPNSVPVV